MAAIEIAPDRLEEILDAAGVAAEIAGFNGPTSLTVSGLESDLDKLDLYCKSNKILFKKLDLDYPFHSALMEPIETEILANLGSLSPQAGEGTFVSTVSGVKEAGKTLTAHYWWENIRKPVQFHKALETAWEEGCRLFIEIGPKAILGRYVKGTFEQHSEGFTFLPSLAGSSDETRLSNFHQTVYVSGGMVEFAEIIKKGPLSPLLPTYQWDKQTHYLETTSEAQFALTSNWDGPLLGERISANQPEWKISLGALSPEFLQDHVVNNTALFPAAGYLEIVLSAGRAFYQTTDLLVEELEIHIPLALEADALRTVTVTLDETDGRLTIRSRPYLSDSSLLVNATAKVQKRVGPDLNTPTNETSFEILQNSVFDSEAFYDHTRSLGLDYGPAFRTVQNFAIEDKKVLSEIELNEETARKGDRYVLHPSLLDGCLQSLFALLQYQGQDKSATYLPSVFGKVEIHQPAQTWVHSIAEITRFSARSVIADFTLVDEHGACVATLKECRFRQFENSKKTKLSATYEQHFVRASDLGLTDRSEGHLQEARATFEIKDQHLPASEETDTVSSLLEVLVSSFILEALEMLDVEIDQGFRVLDLIAEEKIDPVQSRYFSFLLNLLKEDGLLKAEGDRWSLDTEHERYDARDIWNYLISDYPELLPELTVIGRTGERLPEILQGQIETHELPVHSETSLLKHLIEGSAYASQSDSLVNKAAQAQFYSETETRKITLMEFDSHNIQGCKELVKSLPSDLFEYRFVSADPDSYHRAKLEFSDVNGVICQQLDSLSAEEIDSFIASAPKVDILIFRGTPLSPPKYEIVGPVTRALLKEGGYLLIGQNSSGRISSFISGGKPEWWDRSTSTNQLRPLTLNLSTWDQQLSSNCQIRTETLLNAENSPFLNASVLQGFKSISSETQPSAVQQENDLLAVIISDCPKEKNLAARILKERGTQKTIILCPNEENSIESSSQFVYSQTKGFDHVANQLQSNNLLPGKILYLAGITLDDEEKASSSQQIRCGILIDFLKSFAGHLSPKSRLLVATHASQNVAPEDKVIPLQAPVWGLTRVISNEYPDIDCKLVDVSYDPAELSGDTTASILLQELEAFDEDREIVRTGNKRFTSRLRKNVPVASQEIPSRFTLNFSQPGALENLQWYPTEESSLQSEQIEIEMKATGLNFRDVMWAMGILKDEAVENGFAGPSLGMEGAGIITRTGTDVQDFKPGDRVMCFAPRCFADYVVTNTTAVAKIPDNMAYSEAATIPSVFFTIYYALHHLARLEPGERVLIHGAAGGVGLAAIQYCQHIGAEIYVTAGSDEKRDFLKLLGCTHILDSRSLEFADQIMELTKGEGVDVVLNSLSGEAIARNLAILKPFGRFLELGKRDFYADSKIGLRPFRNNITYYGIDADQLLAEKPGLSNKLFREMMSLFEEEVFKPLVHLNFKPSQIEEAFRTLQQSKHIGKIVVSMEDKSARKLSIAREASPANENATGGCCVITGGQSGFGLATAKDFAARSFDHLVLVSRSGVKSPEDQAVIDALNRNGTKVSVKKADVTDEDQLREILSSLRQEGEEITGIIHCAMVLDDGLVSNIEKESLSKVCAPKISGAWHLHTLTLEDPVRLFLLYSSATTYIGNPGQGSYVAANSYLEALAKFRLNKGLPALAVAWGAIDDVGVLSENSDIKDILVKRTGLRAMSSSSALSMLEEAQVQETDNLAILQLDWENITKNFPSGNFSRYNDIRHLVSDSGSVEDVEDFMISIDGKSHDEIVQAVQALVLAQISTITGSAIEKISPEKSLFDLGIDSLMALELVMELERKIGIEMSSMSIMGGGNIADLSEKVTSVLLGDSVAPDESDDLELLLAQHGATDMITTEKSSS
ncbi:MAG: SDR family NAD(P)-dependent oxidoreductase [Sneathiellales bacterium]|nr:SDR family NAD(P)-dependent oxidoreductase [Sneathiellales bacterium]